VVIGGGGGGACFAGVTLAAGAGCTVTGATGPAATCDSAGVARVGAVRRGGGVSAGA
jgi:hypothetical protein